MHPVYIGKQKIGEARTWKSAETLAAMTRGGKWNVASQWWLRGRRRVMVYVLRQLEK